MLQHPGDRRVFEDRTSRYEQQLPRESDACHKVELYHSFEGFTYNVVLGSQLRSMLRFGVLHH